MECSQSNRRYNFLLALLQRHFLCVFVTAVSSIEHEVRDRTSFDPAFVKDGKI